jgi:DNA polymerase III alpha subunit
MDIDIDTPTSFDPLKLFPTVTRASQVNNEKITKHPAGVYFQQIPHDPLTGLSAIPYDRAEKYDYFKVDFLHLSLLDYFENKQQLRALMKKQPNWTMLQDDHVIPRLFQLRNSATLLKYVKPSCVEELADCIALIRPAKIHLQDQYIIDKQRARQELYKMPLPTGCFKRAHAIAYAFNVVVQLHLIENGIYDG